MYKCSLNYSSSWKLWESRTLSIYNHGRCPSLLIKCWPMPLIRLHKFALELWFSNVHKLNGHPTPVKINLWGLIHPISDGVHYHVAQHARKGHIYFLLLYRICQHVLAHRTFVNQMKDSDLYTMCLYVQISDSENIFLGSVDITESYILLNL